MFYKIHGFMLCKALIFNFNSFKKIGGYKSFFVWPLKLLFWTLMMSALGFKAKVGSLIYT